MMKVHGFRNYAEDKILRDRLTNKICYRSDKIAGKDWSKYVYKYNEYFMYDSSSNATVIRKSIREDMKKLKGIEQPNIFKRIRQCVKL